MSSPISAAAEGEGLGEIFGPAEIGSDVVVPRPDNAHGVMVVAFDGGVGAGYFSDGEGPWITRNPVPLKAPPFILADGHVPYYFPPYSVLPLDSVREAAAEYLRTGRRPGRVNWYTVAG